MVEWRGSAPGTLSKKRTELSFRSAKVEIDVLRAKAAEGTIALAYVDESGALMTSPVESSAANTFNRFSALGFDQMALASRRPRTSIWMHLRKTCFGDIGQSDRRLCGFGA